MSTPLRPPFLPLLIAVFLLLTAPTKGWGQSSMTFTVNVIGDEADPDADDFSDGHCDVDPNTAGDQCTLRAAIQNHNANRNLPQNNIVFAIPNAPGSGSIVIKVGSTGLGPLPPVLGSVVITALNSGDNRRIEIDGSAAGGNAIGLQLLGGQCEISFFIINSFSSHGIFISGTPPPGDGGHHIESNYIGTDSTGTVDKGNGGDGILIDNTPGNVIGGLGGRQNVISANKGNGIHIRGLDSTQFGTQGANNNSAEANIIGMDRSKQSVLSNGGDAVLIENGPNNTIGGLNANQGNTMGGTKNGVTVTGSLSEGVKIQGNFIGKDGTGAKFNAGVFSKAGKQLSVEANVFENIDSVGVELFVDADGGYSISKNRFDGEMKVGSKFRFGAGRTVNITYQNNFHISNGLGFDAQETINGTINWIVAGDTIKAGKAGANCLFNASGTKNFSTNRWEGTAGIGFNYAADLAAGVQMKLMQTSEVYTGNTKAGITGKITAGGELSVTMADLVASQNGNDGCRVDFVMGGSANVKLSSTRNQYTANGFVGFRLVGGGLNLDLFQALFEKDVNSKNFFGGFTILGSHIGHSITNCTITDNQGPGIEIDDNSIVMADSNTISGNTIGVLINDASTGTITDNTITGNGTGVALAGTGTGIGILGNSIFGNTGLGIDLGNDGVTPNHTGGPIAGPNGFQNHPVLTSAGLQDGNMVIAGSLNSAANTAYRLEFFANDVCNASGAGEGQQFLGFAQVTTDGAGNIDFSDTITNVTVPSTAVVTSTATDPLNNTSEFSGCITAVVLPLRLLSFTAMDVGSTVALYWTTMEEMNTAWFEVQRSKDGVVFTSLGLVSAAGMSSSSSSSLDYGFVDPLPLAGAGLYRLKMIDRDGTFSYSKIVRVGGAGAGSVLAVLPDPASGSITIRIYARGDLALRVMDMNGRVMRRRELRSSSGYMSIVEDIGGLADGAYILVLGNSDGVYYRRFLKQ